LITSKESVWNCPDRPRVPRTTQNMGVYPVQLAEPQRAKRATPEQVTLFFDIPSQELSNFHPKIPFLIPLTPNSSLKLVY